MRKTGFSKGAFARRFSFVQFALIASVLGVGAAYSKVAKRASPDFASDGSAPNGSVSGKTAKKRPVHKKGSADLGDAVKRSHSLRFDGRTVEAIGPSKYDSLTNLSEGDGAGKRKLYGIPADFNKRAAEENREMGYRQ